MLNEEKLLNHFFEPGSIAFSASLCPHLYALSNIELKVQSATQRCLIKNKVWYIKITFKIIAMSGTGENEMGLRKILDFTKAFRLSPF